VNYVSLCVAADYAVENETFVNSFPVASLRRTFINDVVIQKWSLRLHALLILVTCEPHHTLRYLVYCHSMSADNLRLKPLLGLCLKSNVAQV
jgi:hypothetical protein